MSGRWVIPRLFKLQATVFGWRDFAGRSGYRGPWFDHGSEPGSTQLRWLLHPHVGLPRFPFIIWRMTDPGGGLDPQQLANLDGWTALEFVGLPVDDAWAGTDYKGDRQGPVDNPVPPMGGTLPAVDAALRRLRSGAPRFGWSALSHNGVPLADWEPPDVSIYLDQLRGSPLLESVRAMLREVPRGLDHREFVVPAVRIDEGVHPRLISSNGTILGDPNQPSRGEWGPLGLLLMAAGTDPLAALALGFGTAFDANPEDLYMVTVQHRLAVDGMDLDIELADVGRIRDFPAPSVPENLTAAVLSRTRAQQTDGSAVDSIGISWHRPENPVHTPNSDEAPHPVSYAVARFGPESATAEVLLTERAEPLDGWLPFVASKPDVVRPAVFADHLVREGTIDGETMAHPLAIDVTYAVAAQDIFGRWGGWTTTDFHGNGEPPQAPAVLSVEANVMGETTVEFGWDWSDRSPEFIELVGAYADDPGNPLFTVRLQFGGNDEPDDAGAVIPLNPERQPADWWGGPQDRDPAEPELRFYRLSSTIGIEFAGRTARDVQVQARAQRHLDHRWGVTTWDPDYNISPFTPPVSARLYDPAPPPPPIVPEAPQWASLPDSTGVSRAVLTWFGDQRASDYLVHHATETALLTALGLPGPDTTAPLTDRLAVLRRANLASVRHVFLRSDRVSATSYEATLPRGSRILHMYAVTAVSQAQQESPWPTDSGSFIAVAVPRLAVPGRPSISAIPDAANGTVGVTVGVAPGVPVSHLELHRCRRAELSSAVELMGPPIGATAGAGPEFHLTDRPEPGWRQLWYRAVAWSQRDDQTGQVEARSAASAPVSVLLPPGSAPAVTDVRVNEPGSTEEESMVSWASSAPVEPNVLGSHTAVLEARTQSGQLLSRTSERLDALPSFDDPADMPATGPGHLLARVGPSDAYRLYGWLPRAGGEFAFHATIKVIDPLGRIGSHVEVVPTPLFEVVAVPDVVGVGVNEAQQTLLDARLVPTLLYQTLGAPKAAVVGSVHPPVGTAVHVGTPVLVWAIEREVLVPNVIGWGVDAALQELERAGVSPELEHVALVDWSTAIISSLSPGPGELVPLGTRVVATAIDST